MSQITLGKIEKLASDIVKFGNGYLRDTLLPNLNLDLKNFKYTNAELKTGRHFYLLSYNPIAKDFYISLEKYMEKFQNTKSLYEFELVLAILIFHEFGHHLQYLFNKKVEDTSDLWRQSTADYLAGHLLYHYMKTKHMSTIIRPVFLYKIPFSQFTDKFEVEFAPETVSDQDRRTYNKERASSIEFGYNEAKIPGNIRDFFKKLW